MTRRVFFSFHWDDVWRVNQVRNSWVAEGNYQNAGFIDAADIEKFKKATDRKIKNWINEQLKGTSVTVVLLGSETLSRPFVLYEIERSAFKNNAIIFVDISKVKDQNSQTTERCLIPQKFKYIRLYRWDIDNGRENLGQWIEIAAMEMFKFY